MHQTPVIIPIILIFLGTIHAKPSPMKWDNLPIKPKVRETLLLEPYVKSDVQSFEKKMQRLDFLSAGLHKKKCSFALTKLSRYENYSRYIDFIKKSSYDERTSRINLSLSHTLMPFDMGLNFVIARITAPGHYSFHFDQGFLKGLVGNIYVSEYKKRCLFFTTAKWQGRDSGINDRVFAFFSQILGKLAIERLFKISETLTY